MESPFGEGAGGGRDYGLREMRLDCQDPDASLGTHRRSQIALDDNAFSPNILKGPFLSVILVHNSSDL